MRKRTYLNIAEHYEQDELPRAIHRVRNDEHERPRDVERRRLDVHRCDACIRRRPRVFASCTHMRQWYSVGARNAYPAWLECDLGPVREACELGC